MPQDIVGFLPFVIIVVVFYFLLIRPQRNRQRDMQRLQSGLIPGQRVVTTGGLFATVVSTDEDTVTLETSPGVTSRWAKGAVGRVLPGEPESASPPEENTPTE